MGFLVYKDGDGIGGMEWCSALAEDSFLITSFDWQEVNDLRDLIRSTLFEWRSEQRE